MSIDYACNDFEEVIMVKVDSLTVECPVFEYWIVDVLDTSL